MGITVYLRPSTSKGKKYMVEFVDQNGKKNTVHFGSKGYSDYTIHKDKDRMENYTRRHKPREDWTKSGIGTAGFWSKWILWSKPSLEAAKAYTAKKFGLTIKSGSLPSGSGKYKKKSGKRSAKKPKGSRKRSGKRSAKKSPAKKSRKKGSSLKSAKRRRKRSDKRSKRSS